MQLKTKNEKETRCTEDRAREPTACPGDNVPARLLGKQFVTGTFRFECSSVARRMRSGDASVHRVCS